MFIVNILGWIILSALLIGAAIGAFFLLWYRLPGGSSSGQSSGGKNIVLVTGASSGLGKMYACLADERYKGIDEIWLVARRKDKLEETASIISRRTRCISCDLTDESDFKRLCEMIKTENVHLKALFNCAGFGKIGDYKSLPVEQQRSMIDLNCTAAVKLCNECIPYMSKGDHIVNVCSAAAFQPLGKLGVYAATKAFLLRYTRSLQLELLPKKIMVTAVCPYWIKDTEFIPVAKTNDRGVKHFIFASDVLTVGKLSFTGAMIGLPVVTPGVFSTIHRFFSKLLPDSVLQYIWEGLRRI